MVTVESFESTHHWVTYVITSISEGDMAVFTSSVRLIDSRFQYTNPTIYPDLFYLLEEES